MCHRPAEVKKIASLRRQKWTSPATYKRCPLGCSPIATQTTLISACCTACGISEERILIPKALQPFEIAGITITPFNGLHRESSSRSGDGTRKVRGVPATAYLVEFGGKRWLFPGDTRTYDARHVPPYGLVDGLFAHLWLGCSSALLDDLPPLHKFCRFCVDLQPETVLPSGSLLIKNAMLD